MFELYEDSDRSSHEGLNHLRVPVQLNLDPVGLSTFTAGGPSLVEHHAWDTVCYHGHPCIVECEWSVDTSVAREHWLVLHPTDGTHGSYIITETQLEVDQVSVAHSLVNSLYNLAPVLW